MINENELRIGNLVAFRPNKEIERYCKVLAVSERQIVVLDKGVPLAAEFEPIQLTPEILKKCGGFTEHEGIDKRYFINDGIDFFTIQKIDDGYYLFGSEFTEGNAFNYLHQLQNLYFALYGKELNINL